MGGDINVCADKGNMAWYKPDQTLTLYTLRLLILFVIFSTVISFYLVK